MRTCKGAGCLRCFGRAEVDCDGPWVSAEAAAALVDIERERIAEAFAAEGQKLRELAETLAQEFEVLAARIRARAPTTEGR